MATTALTIGPIHTLSQNVSMALPGIGVLKVRSSAALETSMDESTWLAVTLTNGEAEISAPFIRTTAASAIVTVRRVG